MRYFKDTKQAIELDNTESYDIEAGLRREAALQQASRLYHAHLETIAARLGPKAYQFFRFGFGDTELHDGILLTLNIGDAVNSAPASYGRHRFGAGRSTVKMVIMNYERKLLHSFILRKLKSVKVDIPSSEPLWFEPGTSIGAIYSYETIAIDETYLCTEWLLDSGGTIAIEYEKLSYSRSRVHPPTTASP